MRMLTVSFAKRNGINMPNRVRILLDRRLLSIKFTKLIAALRPAKEENDHLMKKEMTRHDIFWMFVDYH